MRKIQVRSDFTYHVNDLYLDWNMFDSIKPLYFSKDTTKFFKSLRYADPVWSEQKKAYVWIQSDKDENKERVYSIRQIDLTGHISKVSEYSTLKQAEKALKGLIHA